MDDLENARNCFLDMMANADWDEQPDADITSTGSYIDHTTHKLIVSDRELAVLADALGIKAKIYQTTKMAIETAIRETT